MAKAESEAYVVVHTQVDAWPQGTVVRRDAFVAKSKDVGGKEHEYDSLERLLGLGAVRPATAEEARSGRGYSSGTAGLAVGVQMKFAAIDGEIDALRRRVGDQEGKLVSFAALGVKDPKGAKAEA